MTLARQSLGSHMGMGKSELNGVLWESESIVPKSFPPILWLALMFLRGGWTAAQGPLSPFHQEGWGAGMGGRLHLGPQWPLLTSAGTDHTSASREGGERDQGKPWRKQAPAGALAWMELWRSG